MNKPYCLKWSSILVFATILVFFIGCCDCGKPINKNYRESEFTFVLAPKQDPDAFCRSLKKMFPDNKNIVCKTCACDSLVLVTGLDDVSISGQGGEVAATSKVKPQGGDLPQVISHGRNYLLEFPPLNETRFKEPKFGFDSVKNLPSMDSLLIGVMDTGFDQSLLTSSFLYNSGQSDTCYKDDKYGWNFVGGTNDIRDDHPSRHGTFVTQLIVNQGIGKNVRIMPLKVINGENQGELFHFMCAISYAARKNVNIINASLGYYGQKDEVLKRYLDLLKKKNILMVTSAGNESKEADTGEPGDPRDLGTRINRFYPACYNDEYQNIISVTTADKKPEISTAQNYSYGFVNIAVIPKAPNDVGPKPVFEVGFTDGGTNSSILLAGSSFATPVITGRIVKSILGSSIPAPYTRKVFLYPDKKLIGLVAPNVLPWKPKVARGYLIKE